MRFIFEDTCEQDVMLASIKDHIIKIATYLPTIARTVPDEKQKPLTGEFNDIKNWLEIYHQAWMAEIEEKKR